VPRQRLRTVSHAELQKQQQQQQQKQEQQQSTPVAAPSTPLQPAAAGRPPELQSLLVEPTWRRVLLPEFEKPYMTRLEAFLQQQWASHTIYPPQQSIFSAFNSVAFNKVGGV
jgi:uracil-DNA glycosylase